MNLTGMTINFLGDSITEGFGIADSSKLYHQIICKKHNLKYAWNYGLGGTRIARQLLPSKEATKWDLSFGIRAEAMQRCADAVVVFGGTNDYGSGDAPFGDMGSTDSFTFCGAVNSLILKLKEDFSRSKIIFVTPIHRTGEDNPSAPDSKTLKDYADAILQICLRHSIPVIDLFAINPINPYDTNLLPDGLHPSEEGHAILAKVIARELLKI